MALAVKIYIMSSVREDYEAVAVKLRNYPQAIINTLKLSKKSGRDEFLLYLKMVVLGTAVVGAIGYVVQFVASLLRLTGI